MKKKKILLLILCVIINIPIYSSEPAFLATPSSSDILDISVSEKPQEQEQIKEVLLKNGTREPEPLVKVVMMVLRTLIEQNPIVFYELVMKARDPNHQYWGKTETDLKSLSLLYSDGGVNRSVRNIVLSAVTGEMLEMTLNNPLAESASMRKTPSQATQKQKGSLVDISRNKKSGVLTGEIIDADAPPARVKSPIVNTEENPHPSWLLGGNPRAIEHQEKAGQRQLGASKTLPVSGTENKDEWSAIGVVLGDTVDGDPLFRHARFPIGWKLVPTEHDMWSNLVDEKGTVRAEIFYKAAFYDRRADVRLVRNPPAVTASKDKKKVESHEVDTSS